MGVTLAHIDNNFLLQQLFRNYVYSYVKDMVVQEQKKAGSVAQNLSNNKIYKRQKDVSLCLLYCS